jgi:protein phosphatase
LSAFEVPRSIAGERLALGRLTVIDATNVPSEARKSLVALTPERPLPAIILQRASSFQINHDAI